MPEAFLGADYVCEPADASDGRGPRRIAETPAARAFRLHSERMKLIERRLDEAYAGALLFSLLVDHPWLVRCRVAVWGTPEYDDQGGTFVCANVRIDDLVIDHSSASKDKEVIDDTGAVCEELAEEWLKHYLWDDEQALLNAVSRVSGRDGASTEYSIRVDRRAVSDLLHGRGPVSGQAAFAALKRVADNP